MLALKDIAGLAPALGASPITSSPLWNKPVDQIIPAQLSAFRARLAMQGRKAQADATIDFVVKKVGAALGRGSVPMLDYKEPVEDIIASCELAAGFELMPRPMPAAILFGLETGMPVDQVVTLTRQKARTLRGLSQTAATALRVQPISLTSKYAFWRNVDDKAMPLFGLEQEVFDTFGRTWGELVVAYRRIVYLT
jgi:hypothetical protein